MVALTKAQAIARIQQGLGFRTDLAEAILLELRMKQTELEEGSTLPWWLVSDTNTFATVTTLDSDFAEGKITIPVNFIRFVEDTDISHSLVSIRQDRILSPVDYDALLKLGVDSEYEVLTGNPRWWAFHEGHIHVRPIPTIDYSLTATWYAHDADLAGVSDASSNQWLTYGAPILIGAAGVAIARDLEYPEAEDRFLQMYQSALGRMMIDAEIRKSGNRPYAVGAAQ
jgi:hypothetical protein